MQNALGCFADRHNADWKKCRLNILPTSKCPRIFPENSPHENSKSDKIANDPTPRT